MNFTYSNLERYTQKVVDKKLTWTVQHLQITFQLSMAFLSRCASSSLRHSIFVLETALYPPQLGPTQHFVTLSNSETSSLGRSLTLRTRNSHLQSSLPHLWPKNEVVGCAQVHTETWNFSASGAHFYSLSLRARAADDAFFPLGPFMRESSARVATRARLPETLPFALLIRVL